MKYVQIPPSINITLENGEIQEWSFWVYVRAVIMKDHTMGLGRKDLKMGLYLQKLFKIAKVGDWVEIDDSYHELICKTVDNPKRLTVDRSVAEQLLPFADRITDEAVDQIPEGEPKPKEPLQVGSDIP